MKLNKVARIALFSMGIVCLILSAYYLFQLVCQGRRDDTNVRIPQLIQFFGGVVFIVLSKVLDIRINSCDKGMPVPYLL